MANFRPNYQLHQWEPTDTVLGRPARGAGTEAALYDYGLAAR